MKKKSRIHAFFASFLALFALTPIALGDFVSGSGGNEVNLPVATTDERVVCERHTTDTGGNSKILRYVDLTQAIKDASSADKIYVLPGLTDANGNSYPIPLGTCTLSCDLILPYDPANLSSPTSSDGTADAEFADRDAASVKANRKIKVVLQENAVFTVSAGTTLTIGGVIGRGASSQLEGHTTGNYAEISMAKNSTIINKGTIDCYGYIKEEGRENNGSFVHNEGGSAMKLPLVVYDFSGGSYTVTKCYNGSKCTICPFNVFDFPNCKPRTRFDYLSTLAGYADLYAGDQHNKTTGSVIGKSGALVNITSKGSYIENRVVSGSTYPYSRRNGGYESYNDLSLYGDVSAGQLTLHVSVKVAIITINATIKTSDVHLPVSYRYHISVYGKAAMPYKIKFLNGSRLTVKEGGSITFGSEAQFYKSTWNDSKTGTYYCGASYTDSRVSRAYLSVYGSAKFSGAFGGYADVYGPNASLSIAGSTSVSPVEQDQEGNDIYTATDTAQGVRSQGGAYTDLSTLFYVGKTDDTSSTNPSYYWYVGDEVRGNIVYRREIDGVIDSSFTQTVAYDLTANASFNMLEPVTIAAKIFTHYSYRDIGGNDVAMESSIISGAEIVPNVTLVSGVYTLYVTLHYEQAYTTTILYQDYAGNSLGSHEPIVNGNSTTLLADVADKADQDAYNESQTELHKYLYKFHHWVDVSDSSKTYGLDENGVIPYTAPEGDVDRTVTLKAVAEDTSYQTDTYFRVTIKNTSVAWSSNVSKRPALYYLDLDSDFDFKETGAEMRASGEEQGITEGTYIYFVKKSGSLILSLRKGYSALFGAVTHYPRLYTNGKLTITGNKDNVTQKTLGINEETTITFDAT